MRRIASGRIRRMIYSFKFQLPISVDLSGLQSMNFGIPTQENHCLVCLLPESSILKLSLSDLYLFLQILPLEILQILF